LTVCQNKRARFSGGTDSPFCVQEPPACSCCSVVGVSAGTSRRQGEVSNAQELQEINEDLGGDYVLVDDIDASGIGNFEPIGSFDEPFTGSFDGNGHTVTGLTIDRDDEFDVGLFGAVGSGGTVENVGVEEADVFGEQWVGGIVGFNQGTVADSYATGEVFAEARVGTLVGGNEGTVTRSDATGEVTGVEIIGGLVGRNAGTVSESYADVSVAGFDLEDSEVEDLGGLVGVNVGSISDSYATGEVVGDAFAGGLVGGQRRQRLRLVRDRRGSR